jgi:hypothetical protein
VLSKLNPDDNDTVLFRRVIDEKNHQTTWFFRYGGKECTMDLQHTSHKLPEGLTGTSVRESFRGNTRKFQLGGGFYVFHNGWKPVY